MSVDVTALKANFALMLSDWSEALTIKRSAVVYGSSGSTETWTTAGTTSQGAWQSVSDVTRRAEAGLQIKCDDQVFFATTVDVQVGDRIYRASGEWETVLYIRVYPDHQTVFMTKTTGEPA